MNISIRQNFIFLFLWGIISLWVSIHAQFEDFNPSPYTVETTYKKLIKEYSQVRYPVISLHAGVEIKKNIAYGSTGPVAKTLDLYIPLKTVPPPIVLLIHGGGWVSGSKANLEALSEGLANRGFAVANMDYTKSTEAPYPASVLDIKQALLFLEQQADQFRYKPHHIIILGCSAGAQLASLVAVTSTVHPFGKKDYKNVAVQGLINIDGILSFIHPESEEGTYAAYWLGGFPATHKQTWVAASPLTYVGKDTPPTLFINSAQLRFHAGRDDMIKIMKTFNIPSEVHTFDAAPHSFWLLEPWFSPTLDLIEKFIKTTYNEEISTP